MQKWKCHLAKVGISFCCFIHVFKIKFPRSCTGWESWQLPHRQDGCCHKGYLLARSLLHVLGCKMSQTQAHDLISHRSGQILAVHLCFIKSYGTVRYVSGGDSGKLDGTQLLQEVSDTNSHPNHLHLRLHFLLEWRLVKRSWIQSISAKPMGCVGGLVLAVEWRHRKNGSTSQHPRDLTLLGVPGFVCMSHDECQSSNTIHPWMAVNWELLDHISIPTSFNGCHP